MYSPRYNRIEDRAELLAFLRANSFAVLVTRELRASHLPVQVRETESELIRDIEIAVTRLETRWKLSQNRGRREQELVAAALHKSADSAERALAELMRKHLAGE